MQDIKYPYFKKDRILKIEMLENMRDFPRDVLDVYTENLSDGIVCGFTPIVDKNMITFSKGITKYNGNCYMLSTPTSINYKETDTYVAVKLNFFDEIQDNDYKTQYVDIEIDSEMKIHDNQQELGRFKLKKGAYLRSNYKDLYDFTTEYNTINIVNVGYAGYGEKTISTLITRYFAKEILASRTQNALDFTFCMLCMNSQRMERQTICNYISYRLEEDVQNATNMEIHDKLVKIWRSVKQQSKGFARRGMSGSKIIVD